tara:strand:- start:547 stop:963 length:417 start_codon:yes stop_codon:yes gene_type:complete
MVVNGSGKKGLRSFEVVNVLNEKGCETKFNKNSRLVGRNPAGAARKAFNGLCRVKNIRGRCTLNVHVRETTQGSNHKEYMYKCHRMKLKEPLVMMEGKKNEYKIEYTTTAKAIKAMPKCKGRSSKSSGRMRRRTAKKQ